jgi:hypothetical protein
MNTRAMAWSLRGHQTEVRTPYPKSVFVAALFLAILFIPSVQALLGYRLIRFLVAVWALWGFLFLLESRNIVMSLASGRRFELGVFALWCLIVLFYPLVNPQAGDINFCLGNLGKVLYSLLPIIMCYSMGLAYEVRGETRVFPFLLTWLLVGMAVNAVIATPILLGGGLMVRAHLNSYQEIAVTEQNLGLLGLGSLGFYGVMVFLSPFFADLMIRVKGIKKLIVVSLLIPILLTLHLTGLLIIFTTMVLSLVLYVALMIYKLKRNWRLMAALIGIGFFLLLLGHGLSDYDAFEYQMNKIDALLNPSMVHVKGDTSAKRFAHYRASIETFLAFPFLGGGLEAANRGLGSYRNGGHSGVLDGFAMYGLLFCVYLGFLFIKFRQWQALRDKNPQEIWYDAGLVAIAGYFLLILLDPLLIDGFLGGAFFFFIGGPGPSSAPYHRPYSGRLLGKRTL